MSATICAVCGLRFAVPGHDPRNDSGVCWSRFAGVPCESSRAVEANDLASYWTPVGRDFHHNMVTYEHRMPHGTLVMVRESTADGHRIALCFVPAAPHPGQERL